MSDLVRNAEDHFSGTAAHLFEYYRIVFISDSKRVKQLHGTMGQSPLMSFLYCRR